MSSNLYQLRDQEILQGADISTINKNLIEEINNFQPTSKHRLEGVTYEQAQYIIDKISSNRVTSQDLIDKYDTSGEIGFCFGRALYAHLELLRHGVSKQAIKKAFLVGEMNSGGSYWRFHVTTLVKAADDSGWYSLDTIVGEPAFLESWYAIFNATSTDGQLRLFITEPAKFGPSANKYHPGEGGVFDGFYNDYFQDMFQFFQENHLSPEEKFILD